MKKLLSIKKYSLLLFICFFFNSYFYFSQNPNVITLSSSDNGNKIYVAQDEINLLPNYQYQDNSSKMHAYIEKQVAYSTLLSGNEFDQSTINTTLNVGTIQASHDVSESGGGRYSVPIQLPSGTNGLMPNLSIEYNSQSGNGDLGIGWGISGFSSISIVPSNWYNDTKTENILQDGTDKFAIDGQRLIVVSGNYGSDAAIYKTEMESYVKVTSYGWNGIPDWFKVETKDGITIEYGRSDDSRILGVNEKALIWRINKTYDTYGNYVEYKYWNENNETRIDKILYTGNEQSNLAPYNVIKFHYETRNDPNIYFIAGKEFKLTSLISKIEIKTEGLNYKSYEFSYGENHNSFLKSITEIGSNSEKFNATLFKYGNKGISFQTLTCNSFLNMSIDFQTSRDFNGDGKSDLIALHFYYNNGNKIYSSWEAFIATTDNSFSHYANGVIPSGYYLFFNNQIEDLKTSGFGTSLDFFGDGSEDLLLIKLGGSPSGITLEGLQIVDINGLNLTQVHNLSLSSGGFINPGKFLQLGDFDGDGREDIFILKYGSSSDFTYYGKLITSHSGEKNVVLNGLAYLHSAHDVYNTDFDGDSKTELMVIYGNSCEIFELKSQPVNDIYHVERIYNSQNPGYPTQWHKIIPGDFNGDGKTDILTSGNNIDWTIGYSTGIAFVERPFIFTHNTNLPGSQIIKAADFNGDGKADIIHAYNNSTGQVSTTSQLDIYYSKGYQFEFITFNTSLITSYSDFIIGDFNGDGKTDIFNPEAYTSEVPIYYFNRDGQDFLLNKVKNGFGMVLEYNYTWLSKGVNYSNGNVVSFPLNDCSKPMSVVQNLKGPDGIGGITSTEYQYSGAKWHRQGKGFLGFSKMTTIQNSLDVRNIKEYELINSTSIPKLKLMALKKVENKLESTGELISSVIYTNEIISLGGDRLSLNVVNIIENDFLNSKTISTFFGYDVNGNIVSNSINNGIETKLSINQYLTFDSWWIPSRIQSTTTTNTRQGQQSYSRTTNFIYNSKGTIATKIDDPGLSNSISILYQYDDFGNVKKTMQSSSGLPTIINNFIYDIRGRFIIELRNPLNQITLIENDKRWGKPIKVEDMSGKITTSVFNGFGELIEITDTKGITTFLNKEWDITSANSIDEPQNTIFSARSQTPGKPSQKVWYDILNREVKSSNEMVNNYQVFYIKKFNFKGQLESETSPFFQGETPIQNLYIYDQYGRKVSVTNGEMYTNFSYSSTSSTYSVTTTNPNRSITKVYDNSKKIISTTDAGGTLNFLYYSNGLKKSASLSGVILVQIEYDIFGNQTKLIDKNSGIAEYTYNAYGQLVSQKDANNISYQITYDILGREISKSGPDGSTFSEYINSGNGLNQLKKTTGSNGVIIEFQYDEFNRLISKKETINPETFITLYSYNENDRIASMTYPSGFEILYEYDQIGNVINVKDANSLSSLFSLPEMNSKGQFTSYLLGNGKTSFANFDEFGFLTGRFTSGIQDLEVDINKGTGNLEIRLDNLKNRKEEFIFDANNRLINSNISLISNPLIAIGLPIDVEYELNGNIISKSDAGDYSYDANKINAVIGIENTNGNIPLLQQDITYTDFDRTETISEGSNFIQFVYGPDLNRIKSEMYTDGNLIKTKYYSGLYEKEITPEGTKEIHYISTSIGANVVFVIENNGDEKFYYLYKDHLGSIVTVTDENANIVLEQNFDAWGRKRNPNTWSYDVDPIPANLSWVHGFTGHEHLDEFGLINMNNRMYDPILGRMLAVDNFIQDPYFTQSYNRYSYSWNNPVNYVDPNGDIIWFAPIIAGAVMGGAIGAGIAHMNQQPIWTGIVKGAIIGAGIGYSFSSLLSTLWIPGKGGAWATQITKGIGITSGKFMPSYAPGVFQILGNSLLTSSINMASYAIRSTLANEPIDKERMTSTALVGFGAGLIGGVVGVTSGVGSSITTSSQLQIMNLTTSMINGSVDRLVSAIQTDESPSKIARNAFFGLAEGAMSGHMMWNWSGQSLMGQHAFSNIISSIAITQSITSVPGLASMAYAIWAPTKFTFVDGSFNAARLTLGLLGVNYPLSIIGNQPSNYPSEIGNFQIKPYGLSNLFYAF